MFALHNGDRYKNRTFHYIPSAFNAKPSAQFLWPRLSSLFTQLRAQFLWCGLSAALLDGKNRAKSASRGECDGDSARQRRKIGAALFVAGCCGMFYMYIYITIASLSGRLNRQRPWTRTMFFFVCAHSVEASKCMCDECGERRQRALEKCFLIPRNIKLNANEEHCLRWFQCADIVLPISSSSGCGLNKELCSRLMKYFFFTLSAHSFF